MEHDLLNAKRNVYIKHQIFDGILSTPLLPESKTED